MAGPTSRRPGTSPCCPSASTRRSRGCTSRRSASTSPSCLRSRRPTSASRSRAPTSPITTATEPMRAMVLAAGLGTRLRPITNAKPKPMVPVLNRPVMEHILRLLARHGFTETIANLHWFPDLIEGRFGDGSDLGVKLSYNREERLLGTSGGVRAVSGFLGDSFLVISGDALTDIDLGAM